MSSHIFLNIYALRKKRTRVTIPSAKPITGLRKKVRKVTGIKSNLACLLLKPPLKNGIATFLKSKMPKPIVKGKDKHITMAFKVIFSSIMPPQRMIPNSVRPDIIKPTIMATNPRTLQFRARSLNFLFSGTPHLSLSAT